MPQELLPIIPAGATEIGGILSVISQNDQWTYFCGQQPVFQHPQGDKTSFRMITSQFVCQEVCKPKDIIQAFGVSKNSVKRSVKTYRTGGIKAFFQKRHGGGKRVLKGETKVQAQNFLNQGWSRREVADELDILYDTLSKAIQQGRLVLPVPEHIINDHDCSSHKSDRSEKDMDASMGMACTRPIERILAATGKLPNGAPTQFESCRDVSYGGVLCALPALAQNGLFDFLKDLPALKGYYTTLQVILLLAYMALCRIKTVENLQYHPPGELGKLMGLDRVPEVRCLRKKLQTLCQDERLESWSAQLSKKWMDENPELTGTLYVDGHVRLYHGKQTKLPKRFVSRQRLCLRGTTDYYVNDMLGQPFFRVDRTIDHGLLDVLRHDIIPRLLRDIPKQPTEQDLDKDPYRSRFVMVFDREGYSPQFFKEMWTQHRISCLTYLKNPKGIWPEEWFEEHIVTMPNGETITMKLAEQGTLIGTGINQIWVRECRKLTSSGHQTSLISTVYSQTLIQDSAYLFNRWTQENFFGYMMQHYAIDLLSDYQLEKISGTHRPVVNPKWRELEKQRKSIQAKLSNRQARFAALVIHPAEGEKKLKKWQERKAHLLEEIQHYEHELDTKKVKLKNTAHHLNWEDLPQHDQFEKLAPSRKQFVDTIKLLAYRAETVMANIAREKMSHSDEARSLIRDLLTSDADLFPDEQRNELHVRVHTMSTNRSNQAVLHLMTYLNESEFVFPGTSFKLIFNILGESNS